jgi:NTE family protein
MFRLLDISWRISGLVKGDRIIDTLKELVGDRLIEELPIIYTAVAANLDSEREVWLRKGSLFAAIRASMSLPLLLTPHIVNGETLIDGGVLNPVPIAPTFGDNTDLCIAVNLGGAPGRPEKKSPELVKADDDNHSGLRARINAFIDKWRAGHDDDAVKDWGPFEIANQAFDAMQSAISRQKLAVYPPDVLIEIPRNACGTMEFQRAAEMIALGRDKAEEMLGKGK